MRFLTIAAIAAALVGCSNTSTTTAGNNPTNSSAPKLSNSDLEQAVKGQLASNPNLQPDKISVSADADKNQVTLSGTVYSETARTEAVNAAKTAHPGVEVVDKIDVKPGDMPKSAFNENMATQERDRARSTGDKIGTSVDDAWIHMKLSAKLLGDSSTPARKINVDVTNGTVTLRGSVPNAEAKQEAGRDAMSTDGVKHVNNLLRINVG
jgi:hyperosmotically inducible protein